MSKLTNASSAARFKLAAAWSASSLHVMTSLQPCKGCNSSICLAWYLMSWSSLICKNRGAHAAKKHATVAALFDQIAFDLQSSLNSHATMAIFAACSPTQGTTSVVQRSRCSSTSPGFAAFRRPHVQPASRGLYSNLHKQNTQKPSLSRCRQGQRHSLQTISAGPSDVFVLDFDGVIVDSEPEAKHKTQLPSSSVFGCICRNLHSSCRCRALP